MPIFVNYWLKALNCMALWLHSLALWGHSQLLQCYCAGLWLLYNMYTMYNIYSCAETFQERIEQPEEIENKMSLRRGCEHKSIFYYLRIPQRYSPFLFILRFPNVSVHFLVVLSIPHCFGSFPIESKNSPTFRSITY